ncbi:MAG: GTP-binding protein [Erysipelotrichaceae bacterium]|nr:GTP-binding protein [Erysipelotrichaceae bacterium]
MVKVDIISGFLGAGKTTLIAKLINERFRGEKVVLVENEFGEIGIDGGFLKHAGIEIKEINSGCICCSLVGDFEEALKKVVETYEPERIVIEPSGVGKLSDIIKAINTVEGLEINSASTVVDAKKCRVYSKNFKEFFNDQIEAAPCVILSKTADMSDEKLEEAVNVIKAINPKARIITTNWKELDGNDIMKVMEGSFELLNKDDVCPVCGHSHGDHEHHHHDHEHEHEHHHEHDEECECCCEHEHHHHDHDEECECGHEHHHHDHEHHHEHDEECECGHEHHHHDHDEECECGHHHHDHDHHHHHHHADEVFTSIGIETIRKYTKAELEEILGKLDENILRAKGIVMNKDGGWLFFDFVPGDIDVREGEPAYTGLITVIGSKVDEAAIRELFGVR